ncbi:MAG: zinc ABC transporter substrate-binding protein [Spirochaetales bacterium]|nr:zinc ABC transporter substrate-binding protein [Spirochaetales bacterium]
MYRSKYVLALALAMLSASAAFAVGGKDEPAALTPIVAVSILPQAYFVDRISGGSVEALVLVGPGQSPHSYEPTPKQMAELSTARLWFTVGAEFETALVPKISSLYDELKIVDTTIGIKYRRMEAHGHDEDADDDEAHHDEDAGVDPHVWLGRQAVTAMSVSIRDALIAFDPAGAPAYRANYDAFIADINTTFDSLARELAPMKGSSVLVYHPAFGYFLDEFEIRQEAVETGGKEPTQKTLSELIDTAREDGTRVIFVQSQFPVSAATTVAKAIGGTVVTIDPLAPEWLDNLAVMGAALVESLR